MKTPPKAGESPNERGNGATPPQSRRQGQGAPKARGEDQLPDARAVRPAADPYRNEPRHERSDGPKANDEPRLPRALRTQVEGRASGTRAHRRPLRRRPPNEKRRQPLRPDRADGRRGAAQAERGHGDARRGLRVQGTAEKIGNGSNKIGEELGTCRTHAVFRVSEMMRKGTPLKSRTRSNFMGSRPMGL